MAAALMLTHYHGFAAMRLSLTKPTQTISLNKASQHGHVGIYAASTIEVRTPTVNGHFVYGFKGLS